MPWSLLAVGAGLVVAVVVGDRLRSAAAEGPPATTPLSFSGTLTEGGVPADGSRDLTIRLFDAEEGGTAVCSTTAAGATVRAGRFRVSLQHPECADVVAANPELWVEVVVGGAALDRMKVGAVPFALEAGRAISAAGSLEQQLLALVPSGSILPYAGPLDADHPVPRGYLACDGASYARDAHATLFAAIGTAWGAADATHFNVPDLRGRFIRGRDAGTRRDPDVATRTACSIGGNVGDGVGSLQGYASVTHRHISGAMYNVTRYPYGYESIGTFDSLPTAGGTSDQFSPFTSNTGGNETRPINAAVNYVIKI